jgi:flagellar hook-associated protein 3 FlgL
VILRQRYRQEGETQSARRKMIVSDITLFNDLTAALDATASQIQLSEQQLATGRRVNQPSDDPAAYAQAEVLSQQSSAITNDVSIANQVQSQLSTVDNVLAGASNALDSAVQLATQGADGTTSTSQMADLGQEVNALLSQMISLANSQYNGAYVFSGDNVLTAPYSAAGVYSGGANSNSVVLSDGTSMQVNFNGQSIFGDATTGPIGTLTALAAALNSGNKAAVAATLPQLQASIQQIASARAGIGTTIDTASADATNGNSILVTLTTAINNVSGADIAQAISSFQEQSVQQQALVSLGSELNKIPLINILA